MWNLVKIIGELAASAVPTEINPLRTVVEALLLIFIVYLLLQKSYKPKQKPDKLSEEEIATLCEEWRPEPLVPELSSEQHLEVESQQLISGAAGTHATVNGKPVLNFATTNFLGLVQNKKIEDTAVRVIQKYGCGSCGPRGFYGTIDVHLDLETKLAQFMGTEEAVIYSSEFSTPASVIPAFSKIGDLIFCDAGVNHAVQTGVLLSRSQVKYFRHNDVDELERLLEQVQQEDIRKKKKQYRKFVVMEGLSVNYGDIAPLPTIMKLKERYRFRLILDDSMGIGVLGKTGRGTPEHYGIPPSEIEILIGSLGSALASIGGFCCGAKAVCNHQRLNASGYCFSASLPPFLAAGALEAIKLMEQQPDLLQRLRRNVECFRKRLDSRTLETLVIEGAPESPVIHLRLRHPTGDREADERQLQKLVDEALARGVALTRAKYVRSERFLPAPSVRVAISAGHTKEELEKAADVIIEAAQSLQH